MCDVKHDDMCDAKNDAMHDDLGEAVNDALLCAMRVRCVEMRQCVWDKRDFCNHL